MANTYRECITIKGRFIMLNKGIRILMFLTSYFPLFVIIMIKHYEQIEVFYVLIPIIIISSIGMWHVFKTLNKVGGSYEIGENKVAQGRIENTSKSTLEYFLTYVVPLLTFNLTEWKEFTIFGIVFFIIGVLYVKSDLIYMNPTLVLLRYNIYKLVLEDREVVVISKNNNRKSIQNPVIEIGNGVYYERRTRNTTNKEDRTLPSKR